MAPLSLAGLITMFRLLLSKHTSVRSEVRLEEISGVEKSRQLMSCRHMEIKKFQGGWIAGGWPYSPREPSTILTSGPVCGEFAHSPCGHVGFLPLSKDV